MQDDYQYPIKKLPPLPQIGNQRYQASNVALTPVEAVQGSGVPSPFLDDAATPTSGGPGGGSGGGGALEYITDDVDVILGTGSSGSSDSTTINSGATGDNYLYVTTDDVGGGTNKAVAQVGANIFSLAVQDYRDIESGVSPGDLGTVILRQLDICHMGAPGYRSFLCSEAYPP